MAEPAPVPPDSPDVATPFDELKALLIYAHEPRAARRDRCRKARALDEVRCVVVVDRILSERDERRRVDQRSFST